MSLQETAGSPTALDSPVCPEVEPAPKGCFARNKKPIAIGVFLVSGTLSVTLNKVLYGIESEGLYVKHKFEKPWFTNWAMFLGMSLCLVGFFIARAIKKSKGKTVEVIPKKLYAALLIPAVCDMIASFLMGVGLLWIPGSVWQMLRGSIIVFTALLKVFYRKKKLFPSEIFGTTDVVLALVVVGVSSFFTPGEVENCYDSSDGNFSLSLSSSHSSSSETSSNVLLMALGIVLVVLAQALQAFQTILEEKFLHDLDAPETLIVGMEGLYGLLLCSLISMPIAYFLPGEEGIGLHEDTLDSFVMLVHNWTLFGVMVAYVIVILVFNLFGMMITQVTDAMTRNIMEPIRTFLVWVCMVSIFYITRCLGEQLNLWSLLELAGFVILTFGVLVYNNVIKLPCLMPKASEETQPLVVNGNAQ